MHKLVLIGAFAALAVAPLSSADAARARPRTATVVKVTIFGQPLPSVSGKIVFSPKTVKPGPVILKITNTDGEWHRVDMNNVHSRLMGPNGGKAIMRVTFKKPGAYFASCPDDTDFAIAGVLTVGPGGGN